MTEPIYIAQTHEPDNCARPESARAWFEQRIEEARDRGAQFFRATVADDNHGLLFEAWRERVVKDQGEPRWSFAAQQGEG